MLGYFRLITTIVCLSTLLTGLAGCAHLYETAPPKHQFAAGAGGGLTGGFIVGAAATSAPTPAGVAIGSALGVSLAAGVIYDSPTGIINDLQKAGVQVVVLGDITTIYLPSDRIFDVNTAHIKRKAYPILTDVVKLAQYYSHTPVKITGNTDDVPNHKESYHLALNQARSVAAYLWALGINQHRLLVFSNNNTRPIATNHTLKGSGENRHVTVRINRLLA